MSNEKVSWLNLKEYIEQKPKDKKEETLSLPNDEYLIAMVKQRLEPENGLDICDFETELRLILLSRMEKRDEYKQK